MLGSLGANQESESRDAESNSRNGFSRPEQCEPPILRVTPGANSGIDGNAHDGFAFAPDFSEHFFSRIGVVPI